MNVSPVEFTVSASDPNGDPLEYSLQFIQGNAWGATVDPSSGVFTWTPDYFQAGEYTVRFIVTDMSGLTDYEDVVFTVNDVPAPLMLEPIGNKTIKDGLRLMFSVTGFRQDSEKPVEYQATNLPEGAQFYPLVEGDYNYRVRCSRGYRITRSAPTL